MATTTVSSWNGPGGDRAAGEANVSPSNYMLFGLGLATWMEFYTYDGVNLVLPDMAGTLGLSQDEASWILTTYLSALLFGVPLSIWAAAHVGHLRYIIGSAVVFAAASVGCAVAPDFATLLLWRAVQGFAGAGLTMWWRASVYMLMPLPERSRSLMRISVMLYLATAVGLIFCGYVTDNFGWRLLFLPNVLVAAVAVWLLVRYFPDVPRPADVRARSVDKLGILLLGIALLSLQIVLSRGEIERPDCSRCQSVGAHDPTGLRCAKGVREHVAQELWQSINAAGKNNACEQAQRYGRLYVPIGQEP